MRGKKGTSVEWSVYQRRDGVWVIKYRSPVTGKRSEFRIPRADAWNRLSAEHYAQVWYSNLVASCAAPQRTQTPARSHVPTVRELCSKWLAFRKERLRSTNKRTRIEPATLAQNKSNVQCHLLQSDLADMPITGVSIAALRHFFRVLCARRGANTVRNVAVTITAFFDDVQSEEWADVTVNPMRSKKVREEIPPSLTESASNVVIMLDPEPAQRLMTHVRIPVERRVRYAMGFLAGLRDGEIAGLVFERLHLDDAVPWFAVEEALAIHGRNGRNTLKGPKTDAGRRLLPVHSALAAILRDWRDRGWAEFVGHTPEPTDPVVPRWDGGFHRPCSAALFRRDLNLAGCPTSFGGHNFTFHALRHSFLTWLKEAGVSAEDRRALAGHAGRDVEERHYIARRIPALREAVSKIVLQVDPADVLRKDKTTLRPRRERRGIRKGQQPGQPDTKSNGNGTDPVGATAQESESPTATAAPG